MIDYPVLMVNETNVAAAPETIEHSNFFYLKRVNVGQILSVLKEAFWLWLWMSTFFFIFLYFTHRGTSADIVSDDKFWLLIVVPILSWVLRGTAVPAFTIPKLNFFGWILFNLFFLLYVLGWYIISLLPWWASPPFYGAMLPVFLSYIGFVEMGKANCAKGEI